MNAPVSPLPSPAAHAAEGPIRKVGVVGAGVMGAGIAAHVANAGVPVVLEYGNDRASVAVELGADWRVRPSEDLFEAVRAALHPQQLALEY